VDLLILLIVKTNTVMLNRAIFKNLKLIKKSTQFLFQLGIDCR
jgi:hypothetical protein